MHHPFNSNKSRHKPSVCGTSRGCSPRSGSRGRGRPSSRTPPRTRLSELDLGRRTRPGGGESVSGSKLAPSDSSHKHRRAADVLAAAGFGTIMTLQDDLTTAAAKGNAAEVERCLSAGAEVNGRNRFGRTAVQVMMMGSTAVAQVLLRHGADPNVADSSTGATPLHDAARTGFLDTVQLLVEAGADPQAEDREGRSPGDVARQNGHADVAAFLSPGLLNRPEAAHKLN
ncbi:cyclin-dependent kinase 4 inhibitor B [Oryzias latipes]|uniref:Cyclin-dependent kinase inhibitor 2A/B (p15, inhibits CDK4) n=1 Tax=Oryzias latipes TaxID=8090 RepID=A0A3B3HIN9_ORYLA|nr:cyclin-dependent kinase 4 inhibitor B [Oryzias latipes]